MPNIKLALKAVLTPRDYNDPSVILRKILRTIGTTGNIFSRITQLVTSGALIPNAAKTVVLMGNDIGTVGYVLIEHLEGSNAGIGTNPEIACNITDGGGGTLNLYKVGHGLITGNSIVINGATYSGHYTIDSVVDVDNFKVVEVYSAPESTVPVYSRHLCETLLENKDFILFRLNDAVSDMYAVCEDTNAVIEVIVIED